jgi:predicted MFS family arabinose efflux permease
MVSDRHRLVSTRYGVLWIYAALQALTQFEWLRFAPLSSQFASRYGVSEGQIGLLSLVFPLVFVTLAVPCGTLIDRIQVRTSLRIIASGMVGAALLRVLGARYELLLSGQILFALVQPLTLSLIVRLADVWFPANERLRATEIGSMALLAGIGLAFVLVPAFGDSALQSSLKIDAGLLGAVALLTFVAVPADPVTCMPTAAGAGVRSWSAQTWTALRHKPFPTILTLIFLANGYFNAIETWMESILHRRGVNAQTAGIVALLMLISGIAGMALLPVVRRSLSIPTILVGVTLIAMAATAVLFASASIVWLGVTGLVLGLTLAPLPILIEAVAHHAGREHAGTAISLFWLAGNGGGAVAVWALSAAADSDRWDVGEGLLIGLLAVQAVVAYAGTSHLAARSHEH